MSGAEQALALASHYLDVDQPRRALDVLERLADVDLEAPYPWLLRARALHELSRHDEAVRAAREGLARDPESTPLLYVLCDCEASRGDLAAAERAILECLRLDPESAYALCRYALLTAKAGQVDKAARLVEEAARIDPEHAGVARCRMIVAYLRGHDNEAGRHAEGQLARDPDDAATHHLLGQAMFAQGRLREAHRHLTMAARLDPGDEDLANAAREARANAHWLIRPLWPLNRFGTVPVWLAAITVMFGLRALGYPIAATVFALCYIVYCAYSWIAPPLVRRLMGLKSK